MKLTWKVNCNDKILDKGDSKMKKTFNINVASIGFCIFLIFLVLKLTNKVDWSWWWVTSPLWIPWALFFIIFVLILTFIHRLIKYIYSIL